MYSIIRFIHFTFAEDVLTVFSRVFIKGPCCVLRLAACLAFSLGILVNRPLIGQRFQIFVLFDWLVVLELCRLIGC